MTRRLMELYHEYTERLRNNAVAGSYLDASSLWKCFEKSKLQVCVMLALQVSQPDCTACMMKAGLLLRQCNAMQCCTKDKGHKDVLGMLLHSVI